MKKITLFLLVLFSLSFNSYGVEFKFNYRVEKEECVDALNKGELINKLIRTEQIQEYGAPVENQISYSWYIYKDKIYAITMSTYKGQSALNFNCYKAEND